MDIIGAVVLFFVLIVIGIMQAGVALGVMYGMHKYYPDKLTETTYGQFDFDNYQLPAFQQLLIRLAVVFVGTTLVLHMLDYFFIGTLIRKYRMIVCLVLFVLEVNAIGWGLYYLFNLDRFRLMVLTAASALFYILCLWYMATGKTFLA